VAVAYLAAVLVAFAGVQKALWAGAGGKVGLIDYGQSKQLPDDARIAFAKLVVAMDKEDKPVCQQPREAVASE
jgi:hypothetical protein